MALAIEADDALARLTIALRGRVIDRVEVSINGWELRLQRKDAEHSVRLVAEEPRVPEEAQWLRALAEPPFELELEAGHNDRDTTAAIAVFSLLNDAKVEDVGLSEDGGLKLRFEGGQRLEFPGSVEQVVWAWKIEWGQLVLMSKGGEYFSSHS